MNEVIVQRVIGDDVQFTLMATVCQFADLHIPANEVPFKLQPLGNELFQMISHCLPPLVYNQLRGWAGSPMLPLTGTRQGVRVKRRG